MIRNAVIHFNGRLPMLADLRSLPGPRDVSVMAKNVRTRDGKRPSFVEEVESWFLVPLREVVVIELPSDVLDELDLPVEPDANDQPAKRPRARSTAPVEAPLVLAEQAVAEPDAPPDDLPIEPDDLPIEPDEELLARIRQL